MLLLFQLIAICSIWTLGIKISTSDGMILENLGEYGKKKVDEGYRIFEALLVCHWCLPSFHSVFAYAFACGINIIDHFEWKLVIMYPLVVMGASILNGMVWSWHEKVDAEKEFYEKQDDDIYFRPEGFDKNNIYSKG